MSDGDRLKKAESADQLSERMTEGGLGGDVGVDVGADAETGPDSGVLAARGNMEARMPVAGPGESGDPPAPVDRRVPYPAAGLDTDEAQEEDVTGSTR